MASQDAPTVESVFSGLDTLWVLIAAALVFFMQAGFGMVEAGLIRTKNAANVLMKNLMDFCFAALGFFIFGYAIAYGGSGPLFGTSGWFMVGVDPATGTLPTSVFWLFQAVFAGTAATIVSGAMAERMRFTAYLMYSFLLTAFIYPVVAHWVWGGGWLAALDFHDFAGSTVVHGVGGTAALVGARLLGPRIGRFNKDGSPNVIAGHNLPLVMIGVFILWFGWYGFNAGSTLGMAEPEVVGRVAMNTITAPCAVVSFGSSIAIGLVAGVLVVYGVVWLNGIRIDDPVGAIPVHGLCGVWGTLAVGLFGQASLGSPSDGLLLGGGFGQLGTQSLGVVACLGFTGVAMFVVFKAVDAVVGLRVPRETELRGLDHDEHGMDSYGGFQIFTTE
jgi:Amt family ammonium transporter